MAGVDNTATTPPGKRPEWILKPPATSLCVAREDQNSKGGSPVAEIALTEAEIFCGEATGGGAGIRYLGSSEAASSSQEWRGQPAGHPIR
ncbi:hypothetical protein SSP24_24110 [Streptomyces spinoverrucosus]|uniref:Uncharacterized protein n=1 Tax=Streptomyces spinoverrucosus TaxID=284043 RepID=A0A4Y3VI98_9ACTN|nr:hypothetical protein SSP24_24110 [Streptomyces spinoverrucosus]GHB59460.1 hypothetical protein GCM10010397_31950 [Streptomyces spinoverrucosus]